MEKRKLIIGIVSTLAGVICRIVFDGIFFSIVDEENYIGIFVVVILLLMIFTGLTLMNKIMPIVVKIMGASLLGAGVGGAIINALEYVCLSHNMNDSTTLTCQCLGFVVLFILSGVIGAREEE